MLALIMAGGTGTRFWPRSREKHPKQLLRIVGNDTMIRQTVARLTPIIPEDNIFVVTTQAQVNEIRSQLPNIPDSNFIIEPLGKNTAPCIGLGTLFMRRLDPNAVSVVLPADHLIQDEVQFRRRLSQADKIAAHTGALVTIGITPNYPATGYGYIQRTDTAVEVEDAIAYQVKTFAEKPNLETARRFLESGDFFWNSGIFVWRLDSIWREIEEHLPEIADGLTVIDQAIGTSEQESVTDRVYRQIRSISIDYGIMEYAKQVVVLPGDFGWNDVGSWDEVYKIAAKDDAGNAVSGNHIVLDSHNCLIDAPERVIAAIGLKDLIVVDTPDAVLICHRSQAQAVKDVVEQLKRRKTLELL